jgi:hypothetical protein
MNKVIVCSVPKSGTYFLGHILTRLGMRDTKIHVHLRSFTDYNEVDLETARKKASQLSVEEPLEKSLRRIGPGEFAVGHLPIETVHLLRDFRVVFIYRNVRDILVSFCRWIADTGRWPDEGAWRELPDGPDRLLGFLEIHGTKLRKLIDSPAAWRSQQNITQVSFEELMGDYGSTVAAAAMRRIASTLAMSTYSDGQLLDLLEQSKASETITRSGGRSVRATYWNEVVEREFARRGFAAINTRLGFDEPSANGWWGHWWAFRKQLKSVRFRRRVA